MENKIIKKDRLKDISWKCLKCKNKRNDYCYNQCDSLNNKSYPSLSNIGWHLPIIKHIKSLILDLQYKKEIKKEEKEYISEYETTTMKHIFGVVAYDDLTSNHANLYTMNDLDLTYLKDKKKYILGVETIYMFKNKNGDKEYMKQLLDIFTKWMIDNNYKINSPCLWEVFTDGWNINTEFDTIEDAYAMFKLLVGGYILND